MNPTPAASAEPIVSSADQYWISVQIGEAFGTLLDADHLHALAVHTLQAEGHNEPLEVGITITDDEEIHALNKEYLDHDYPTDVISFGAGSPLAERIADIEGETDETTETEDETGRVGEDEYVTEGYEGDEEPSGAQQPLPGADAPLPSTVRDPQAAAAFVTPPDMPSYLGDVVISYDTAATQAGDYGHSPAAEVDVLLVHGLLHLLGHDDHDPADRARMHARQDEIIAMFRA